MKIVLRKTSLIDYPGKIAAVLFFLGCNLRCPWCHNRELIVPGEQMVDLVTLPEALEYIKKRRTVLGGVVLSGGEPTLYSELPDLIRRIKALNFLVKLDTNGTVPAMLETLFQEQETRPDYIALDLKVSPRRYDSLTSHKEAYGINLEKSAALIHNAGILHEFRTLAFPNAFVTAQDVVELAPLVDDAPWYFRQFRPGNCLDPAWDALASAGSEEAEVLAQKAKYLGKNGIVRKFPRIFSAPPSL